MNGKAKAEPQALPCPDSTKDASWFAPVGEPRLMSAPARAAQGYHRIWRDIWRVPCCCDEVIWASPDLKNYQIAQTLGCSTIRTALELY